MVTGYVANVPSIASNGVRGVRVIIFGMKQKACSYNVRKTGSVTYVLVNIRTI